jgi:hypothetical protein
LSQQINAVVEGARLTAMSAASTGPERYPVVEQLLAMSGIGVYSRSAERQPVLAETRLPPTGG